jgi:hypothetical protein
MDIFYRSRIPYLSHDISFESTNISILNTLKMFVEISDSSTTQSVWNSFFQPDDPIIDTYTLHWTHDLDEIIETDINIGEPVCEIDICANNGEIQKLYTEPKVRNMGLARHLLCYVYNKYPHLSVRLENTTHQHLFESCGVKVSIEPVIYDWMYQSYPFKNKYDEF